MKRLAPIALALFGFAAGPALAQSLLAPGGAPDLSAPTVEKVLSLKVAVPAPVAEVWKAWTTAGSSPISVQNFFRARIATRRTQTPV